jgi:hypothetical protein
MRKTLVAVGLFALCSSVASGQDSPFTRSPEPLAAAQSKSRPPAVPQYGTTDLSYIQIPAGAFQAMVSTTGVSSDLFGGQRWATTSFPFLIAPLSVPSGARIVYLEMDYVDQSGSDYVILGLVDCSYLGTSCAGFPNPPVGATNCNTTYGICSGTTEMSPAGGSFRSATLDVQVNNYLRHYHLLVGTGSDGATRLAGAIVGYRLEVSPSPGNATFTDVPANHPFFRFIEALYASGITAGCGGDNFCPDAPLTRGQMAVFLAVALGLHWP